MGGGNADGPSGAAHSVAMHVREWAELHLSQSEEDPRLRLDGEAAEGSECETLLMTSEGKPQALLCVWTPDLPADLHRLLVRAAASAQVKRVSWFATLTIREACLWQTPPGGAPVSSQHLLRRYAPILTVPQTREPTLDAATALQAQKQVGQVLHDIRHLHQDGHLRLVDVDATFFVHRLAESVRTLCPWVQKSLVTTVHRDREFKSGLATWAARQGIPNFDDEPFYTAVARQVVYRLLGKVILYQSLRRQARHLLDLDFRGLDQAAVMPRLGECFAQARAIDYQAVFEQDVIDSVPFPLAAVEELVRLTDDLNRYNFASMPQEVLGEVFERLIPAEDRHALGQYFTREDLVDLILAFCLRSKDDTVLDPTCGTGTFLLRAYNHHWVMGEKDHSRLLSRLWGVDVAPFPAELATINLYRQNLAVYDNFPRIICHDFFEVTPGQTFRFPPPKAADTGADFVNEPLPVFDAAVGNFPYIRQESIESRVPGYKRDIERRLAHEWLADYPELFDMPRKVRSDYDHAIRNGVPLDPLFDQVTLRLSGLADIYAYLFIHAARLVRPGGRMGFLTSNAWLDAAYGYELQRFLLNNFRVIACLESRSEPWFDEAKVNTVVTIVERCPNARQRDANLVRFIKAKKRLRDLIPHDMMTEGQARWGHLRKLAQRATRGQPAADAGEGILPATVEDEDLRIRVVRQHDLRIEVEETGRTVKWGRLLRGPDALFELQAEAQERLCLLRDVAPASLGCKTELNEFFYLTEDRVEQSDVEPEFLLPLIKFAGDDASVRIDAQALPLKVFVCREPKERLRESGRLGALRYIEWGEHQRYSSGTHIGLKWCENPWIQDRRPGWWALPTFRTRPSQVFFMSAYGDRFVQRFSEVPLIADKRLYFLSPPGPQDAPLLAAVLNSTVVALFIETTGRVTLGDGVLELTVEEAGDYLMVPDMRRFSRTDAARIIKALAPLLSRPIGSIFDEVHRADRRKLDEAVLRAMGLKPAKYLDAIYGGATSLVRERIELGKMRGSAKGAKAKRNTAKARRDAAAEVLPDGVRKFPDEFLDLAAKRGPFREIVVPDEPLEVVDSGLFCSVVSEASDFRLSCRNTVEAKYIVYARHNGSTTIRLPDEQINLFRTVKAYETYLRDTRKVLLKTLSERTLDHKKAAQLTQRVWAELGLPPIED